MTLLPARDSLTSAPGGRSPQTNGMIERYHGAIKIEALWRDLPDDGLQMTRTVDDFRELYNHVRPYEALAGDRPIERYLLQGSRWGFDCPG